MEPEEAMDMLRDWFWSIALAGKEVGGVAVVLLCRGDAGRRRREEDLANGTCIGVGCGNWCRGRMASSLSS